MDKQEEIALIWWQVLDVAYICRDIRGKKFTNIYDRIHEFQFALWKICNKPMRPRPSGGVSIYTGNYNNFS